MPTKLPNAELSISARIAARYVAAAKRLGSKSSAAAPSAARLIELELLHRTPAGILEDFAQGSWKRRGSDLRGVLIRKRSEL